MNAKKIMGAVLVALLAAALFVGAGAAADKGTYFVYQDAVSGIAPGVWTNGAATVQVTTGGDVIPGENFVPGTYKYDGNTVTFTYPSASYAATGKLGDAKYIIANGGKVYNTSGLELTAAATAKEFAALQNYLVTYPNGTVVNVTDNPFPSYAQTINEKGTYKVQAIFAASEFIDGTPNDLLLDKASFSFTVVGADDATISAATSTVYGGEAVEVTVEGTPGYLYNLSVEGLTIAENQFVKVNKESGVKYNISMPNTGKATFTIVVNTSVEEATIKLEYASKPVKNGEITIKVAAPVVTAALEADSYYLGETIKVTGTSTSNANLAFAIKGTNLKEEVIILDGYKAGKTWEGELDTQELQDKLGKKLDVGTYTIVVKQGSDVVAALPVALKQPFISLTSAPEVVVQGTDAKFVGIAEAATEVYYYVFGTNYFIAKEVGAADFDENQFTFTIEDDVTKNMSAGQYFAVIQHPMYNKQFNIAPEWNDDDELTGAILLNTTADATEGTVLFNVTGRQTANAAQALCDALDSQNIDDMYVKYAFIVAGKDQSFVVNEIPTEVVKGDKFTVSGTSTANKGDYVTVEMISTAFAAVPKETVGSASFITLSTKVAEDGTWEVTFDTSDLNVDEYSVKVACKDTTWKTVTVNVVAAADKPDTPDTPDVPDTPDTPDTPTEPETPGFGALAALAGLGAVAVLLLRRE